MSAYLMVHMPTENSFVNLNELTQCSQVIICLMPYHHRNRLNLSPARVQESLLTILVTTTLATRISWYLRAYTVFHIINLITFPEFHGNRETMV